MFYINPKTKIIAGLLFCFCPLFLFSQLRSFSELFPSASNEQLSAANSSEGYFYSGKRTENLTLHLQAPENTRVSKASLGSNPDFFIEALRLIPNNNASLLNIYNALERIEDLKGRTYLSATSNRHVPLFTNATRIEGPQNVRTLHADPPPAALVPHLERFYVRLTDSKFGHCYYEISIAANRQGILYKINNFRSVTYGPFPVMRERTFTALLYIEPVKEGLALYCLAGAEVSDFITRFVDI